MLGVLTFKVAVPTTWIALEIHGDALGSATIASDVNRKTLDRIKELSILQRVSWSRPSEA